MRLRAAGQLTVRHDEFLAESILWSLPDPVVIASFSRTHRLQTVDERCRSSNATDEFSEDFPTMTCCARYLFFDSS